MKLAWSGDSWWSVQAMKGRGAVGGALLPVRTIFSQGWEPGGHTSFLWSELILCHRRTTAEACWDSGPEEKVCMWGAVQVRW